METALSSQPNQSFTFPDTPEELEGILEIPDRPEITGGYADVYHGFWTNSQGERVDVAIKILKALNPRSRQSDQDSLVKKAETRIKREIFFWSQTRHCNLHPFLGYRLQPQPHLVSPWCRHGDLEYYLQSHPNLSRYEKLLLVYQAGCGLHHLHSCSPPICHADIKPGNVLVNNLGQAALSDFGLSRAMLDLDVTSGFTTSETVKGTFAYMAGELSSGQKPSCASDVYAFGGLILTVMSNQPPFHGLAQLVILRRIMQNEPPDPEDHPGLPAQDPLWELMRRCWDQRPAARPTISEVLIDLPEDIGLKQPDPQSSSDLATPVDAGGSDYPETDFQASAKHTREEIDSSNTSKETHDHILEVVPNARSFSVSPKANVPSPTPKSDQPTPTGDGRDEGEAFPRAPGQPIAVQQPGQPFIVTAPPPGQPLIVPTGQPIMIPLQPGHTGQPPIMIEQPGGGAPFALQPGQQYIIGQPGMPFVQQLQPIHTGVPPTEQQERLNTKPQPKAGRRPLNESLEDTPVREMAAFERKSTEIDADSPVSGSGTIRPRLGRSTASITQRMSPRPPQQPPLIVWRSAVDLTSSDPKLDWRHSVDKPRKVAASPTFATPPTPPSARPSITERHSSGGHYQLGPVPWTLPPPATPRFFVSDSRSSDSSNRATLASSAQTHATDLSDPHGKGRSSSQTTSSMATYATSIEPHGSMNRSWGWEDSYNAMVALGIAETLESADPVPPPLPPRIRSYDLKSAQQSGLELSLQSHPPVSSSELSQEGGGRPRRHRRSNEIAATTDLKRVLEDPEKEGRIRPKHVNRRSADNQGGLNYGKAPWPDDFVGRLNNKAVASLVTSAKESTTRRTIIVKEEGKTPVHYQLGNCIGRGQFGSVYRALNINTGQIFAVKRIRLEGLPESEITELMKEVDLLKRLHHPSIVQYEGMVRNDDSLDIVLEYVENGSLGQTLKAFGKFNEKLVATYVTKILEGLHYLHEQQVVHCDLKAANILSTKNSNIKLSDFGLSLALNAMENAAETANIVAGTPNWMAPEVIELKGVSTASDIWSLGCTVVELLTGKPPYSEIDNTLGVMFRIVEDDKAPIPDDCSETLRDFLAQCFMKDPAERPTAESLFEHPWLKRTWDLHKELRPVDSVPFLRRISTDLAARQLSIQNLAEVARTQSTSPASPLTPGEPESVVNPHTFVKTMFSKAVTCKVCQQSVKKNAVLCEECALICHATCAKDASSPCDARAQLLLYSQYAQDGLANGSPGLASSSALPSPALPPDPRPLDVPLSGSPSVNNAKLLVPPWKRRGAATRVQLANDPTRRIGRSRKDSRTDSKDCVIQ